ncbi:glycosyltransferase family 39 protein [Gemmata sp. G18]|uniref:Glycosyltransferase family 39 protein n=1 Tax=Gemmata palustris TaxID=2822762 RepID=A0ABS5BST8_9BACT|nr:glycosyltransferase family 39 protein [Gemmata palustris]MBP3956789.1 glycosyltransferase family 39 protein [Gemmata palustris]
MPRSFLAGPFALAALVTLANVAKPVTVDDTAYLLFARHIASDPTDPYGFSIFWWNQPEPAMEVLCPPVVPYWLALGVKLFGEHVGLLKLWLFPFILLLAWAMRSLLVRFARGTEHFALPLLMLSPAVLPAVNLMLDVPAVALALASVELFIRAALARNWWRAALAGIVAGLAMQTKYSAFVAPAVIVWFGLTHRRVGLAALATGLCVAVFVGWEVWLVQKYGRSHFAFHASSSGGGGWEELIESKFELVPPLASYLGCLAVGAGLLAGSALRISRQWLAGVAITWCIGFALVAILPRRWTLIGGDLPAATGFWQVSGVVWFGTVAACACVLLVRVRNKLRIRANRTSLFLVGWFVIEVVAVFGLTPFPAARRVIGVSLVMGLIAARTATLVRRARPERTSPRWVLVVGIGAGVLVAAFDTLDAYPEKVCARGATHYTRDRRDGETVWFVGHWGFQFYCEREGMMPLIAKQTVARAGDFVVLPLYPEGDNFPRPYGGFAVTHPPEGAADAVGDVECDDWLSAKTVPNFYGGADPVSGRDSPRLRVRVYRLKSDWVMR